MMRLIAAFIAIVAGGGAGWLALEATWRDPPNPATVVVEAPKLDVLTPDVDLLRGAVLERAHLTWTPWLADQVKPGMILKRDKPDALDAFGGRVLRENVYAGEPVRMQQLAKGAGGFLSLVLQPGMRAVGVKISDDKTAGGFVLPNDRVDVLCTVMRRLDGLDITTGETRTILTNVRVLAIGTTTLDSDSLVTAEAKKEKGNSGRGDSATAEGKTATLEVSPRQAEVLLAAAASGQLSLALRAADDFGPTAMGDIAMLGGAQRPAMPSSAERPQRQITIISTGVPHVVLAASSEESSRLEVPHE